MKIRMTWVVLGVLFGTAASAQSLENRVQSLEDRMQILEVQLGNSASASKVPKTQPDQSWRSLKRGMNEGQVRSVLGEPQRVQVTAMYTKWEYAGEAEALFSPDGRLAAWEEPR